jgi:hypothetical protein
MSVVILPKPTKNALGKYGYYDVKNMKVKDRHEALLKGVKDVGYKTIVGRVNLIATYNKNNNPSLYILLKKDMDWMKKNLGEKYAKTMMPIKINTKVVNGVKRQLYKDPVKNRIFYRTRDSKTNKLVKRYVKSA